MNHRSDSVLKISIFGLRVILVSRIIRFIYSVIFVALSVASLRTDAQVLNPPDQVVFGGDRAYPPFEWIDEGSPVGYNIDIARAIGNISGTDVKHRLDLWPETIRALETGDVDVVPMFSSPQRREKFLFTTPFHYIDHAIYARKNTSPVYAVAGLRDKRVVVEERSFAEQQLHLEGVGATVVTAANTLRALEAVAEGRADYAVLAVTIANRLIHDNDFSLLRLGPPFWSRGYAFAVRKDRPELQGWLQHTLDLAIATGPYQNVYEKWEPELELSNFSSGGITRTGIIGICVLALLAALAFIWSWTLRRRVRVQSSGIRVALDQVHASESRAKHFAAFDSETGLAKSHYFSDLVDEQIGESSSIVCQKKELLILQMADFNDVLSAFGKNYSDEWTRRFSGYLRNMAHGPCAYFGRGVFAIFSDQERMIQLSEALREQRHGEEAYAHLVGGSAYFPEHGKTSAELISKAEIALNVGLSSSKQWVVYGPEMEPDPLNTAIVSAFRETPVEGLRSVFQPQIDLKSETVVGAEALVRWDHPVLGSIRPDKFIPLIEKAGLVSKVTELMIDEGARLSATLRRIDFPVVISVNIAIDDLVSTDLPNILVDALARHNAQPVDLKLELTETSFASDSAYLQGVLNKIRQLGVGIAIDDFGTGYSSLSYLSIFPIQELKIDRSFVSDMAINQRNRKIVRSTITLAQQLGLVSVAEGAEDSETVRILHEFGCDRVQGYVFSKPLEEPDFMEFVKRNYD